jgi:hypothetical protein
MERADGVSGVPTVPSYQKRSAPTGSLAPFAGARADLGGLSTPETQWKSKLSRVFLAYFPTDEFGALRSTR